MGRNVTSEDPKVLYRYRHLQGDHREWTKRILTDSVLYFASPSSFSDPFDCKVHFRSSLSPKQLKQKYADLVRRNTPELNREQRRAKVASVLATLDLNKVIAQMTNKLQDVVNGLGILSLSATNSNILLWSHYAAGHTGLCLKFLATSTTDFFGYSQPVEYSPNYPEIDLLNSSAGEQAQAFLLTKAIDWEYEQEWRIIDHEKGLGDKKFPQEMLLEVIFGARMEPKDKNAVVEWVKDRNTPVYLSQASLADGAFSLMIEPYES